MLAHPPLPRMIVTIYLMPEPSVRYYFAVAEKSGPARDDGQEGEPCDQPLWQTQILGECFKCDFSSSVLDRFLGKLNDEYNEAKKNRDRSPGRPSIPGANLLKTFFKN